MTLEEIRDRATTALAEKGEDHATEIKDGLVYVYMTEGRKTFIAYESAGEISLRPARER